jgi:hypothetical protein
LADKDLLALLLSLDQNVTWVLELVLSVKKGVALDSPQSAAKVLFAGATDQA